MSREVYYETMASGDILVDENGDPLDLDLEFPTSDPGGGTGATGTWKAPVATVGDLPTADNTVYDARYVAAVRRVFVWNGNAWQPLSDTSGGGGPTGTLTLGDVLSWFDENGDTAGGFEVREGSESATLYDLSLSDADPDWSSAGYSGLVWYAATETNPAGYEPRTGSGGNGQHIRREFPNDTVSDRYDVYVEGQIHAADTWEYVAATIGQPSSDYLYGLIDGATGELRLVHIDPAGVATVLASAPLGVPLGGATFWIDVTREKDQVTLTGAYTPSGGSEIDAEVSYTLTAEEIALFTAQSSSYVGLGTNYGASGAHALTFTYAAASKTNSWRELVALIALPGGLPTEFIMADTRTGWLMGGGSSAEITLNTHPTTAIDISGPRVTVASDGAGQSQVLIGDTPFDKAMLDQYIGSITKLSLTNAFAITDSDPNLAPKSSVDIGGRVGLSGTITRQGSGEAAILPPELAPPTLLHLPVGFDDGSLGIATVEDDGTLDIPAMGNGRSVHLDSLTWRPALSVVFLPRPIGVPSAGHPFTWPLEQGVEGSATVYLLDGAPLASYYVTLPTGKRRIKVRGGIHGAATSVSMFLALPDEDPSNWHAIGGSIRYRALNGPHQGGEASHLVTPSEMPRVLNFQPPIPGQPDYTKYFGFTGELFTTDSGSANLDGATDVEAIFDLTIDEN